MKKTTIQFLCVAMVMLTLSVTEASAQWVRLKDGKATIRATVAGGNAEIFSISARDFRALRIKQTNRGDFRYELRRGTELLSSGHTAGLALVVEGDDRGFYYLIIINDESVARRIVLEFMETGGGNPTV
jgi:hypothetical protein